MTQRLDYTTVAAGGMKALGSVYGYVSRSGLPPALTASSQMPGRISRMDPDPRRARRRG